MSNGLSSLAHLHLNQLKDVANRTTDIFGVAIHQTGSTIVEQALKVGANPLEYAAEFYLNPDNYFAHYVVGHSGEIIQIANEIDKAQHIGFNATDRTAYLDGSWVNKLPKEIVSYWRLAWPGYKSPAHLFPGSSPNNVLVGIEMLPVVKGCGYETDLKLKYTQQQHLAIVELCLDIAKRNDFPPNWSKSNRLVSHEDINPLQRHTKKPPGCWDPGFLRKEPWFDFVFVRNQINNRENI